MKKDLAERTKMVEAMEYICRQINDERTLDVWLTIGVADGDIEYGCFDPENENAMAYAEDDFEFSELMATFLRRMCHAAREGGLYCNGVVAESGISVKLGAKGRG